MARCNMRRLFPSSLYKLALCMAKQDDISIDKIHKLLGMCPKVSDGKYSVDQRSFHSVVALGLFLVKSDMRKKNQIVPYFVQLLKNLPVVVWSPPELSISEGELPMPEQFSFYLAIVLTDVIFGEVEVNPHCGVKYKDEILIVCSQTIKALSTKIVNCNQKNSPVLCTVLIPSLLGLCRGFGRLCCKTFVLPKILRLQEDGLIGSVPVTKYKYPGFQDIIFESICGISNDQCKDMKGLVNKIGCCVTDAYKKKCSFKENCKSFESLFSIQQQVELFGCISEMLSQEVLMNLDLFLKSISHSHYVTANEKHLLAVYESFSPILILVLMNFIRDCLSSIYVPSSEEHMQVTRFVESMFTQSYSKISALLSEKQSLSAEKLDLLISQCWACASCVDVILLGCKDYEACQRVFEKITHRFQSVESTRLFLAHMPLLLRSIEGLGDLVFVSKSHYQQVIEVLKEFLIHPAPVLIKFKKLQDAVGSGVTSISGLSGTIPQKKTLDSFLSSTGMSVSSAFRKRSTMKSIEDPYNLIRDTAMESICRALSVGCNEDPDCVPAMISSLSNKIYSLDITSCSSQLVSMHCVHLLSRIALSSHEWNADIFSQVVATLHRRLYSPASPLDDLILNQFALMAVFGTEKQYQEILNILLQLCVKSSSSEQATDLNSHGRIISYPVANALANISVHIGKHESMKTQDQDPNEIVSVEEKSQVVEDLLVHILQLFVQTALVDKRDKRNDKYSGRSTLSESSWSSDNLESLRLLLPIIATLLDRLPLLSNPTARFVKLFRDFWLYCMLFELTDEYAFQNCWPDQLFGAVCLIAIKSPLLTFSGGEPLRTELKYNSALKNDATTQAELLDIRNRIVTLLGNSFGPMVSQMDFSYCAYLLSVFKLEKLRVLNVPIGSYAIAGLFLYLEDQILQKDKSDISKCIHAVFDHIFKLYLDRLHKVRECEGVLVETARFLLVKFNNPQTRIRKAADKYLSLLVDLFPNILWNKDVMYCMLHVVEMLSQTLHTDAFSEVPVLNVPSTHLTIRLQDSLKQREKIAEDFSRHCGGILKEAMKWAPASTASHLQEYLITLNDKRHNWGFHHNYSGPSLALKTLLSESGAPISLHSSNKAIYATSMVCRSKYIGEVDGILSVEESLSLPMRIIEKYHHAIGNEDEISIGECVYRATAVLVTDKYRKQSKKMMRIICMAAVDRFSAEMLSTCINCWQWLLSARSDLEMDFMTEICSAWEITIKRKLGMFSPYEEEGDPLAVLDESKLVPNPPYVLPHLMWIEFLQQRFEIVKYSSISHAQVVVMLLIQSLPVGVPQKLISRHISAIGARSRLVCLGFAALHNTDKILGALERNMLRERAYCVVLDYFCCCRQFPTQSYSQLKNDIDSAMKLWQAIHAEKKYLAGSLLISDKSGMSGMDSGGPLPTLPSSASFSVKSGHAQDILSDGISVSSLAVSQNWLTSDASFTAGTTSSGTLTRQSVTAVSTKGSKKSKKAVNNVTKDYMKRRSLLMYLLTAELEHLITWNNPTSNIEKMVEWESTVSAWRTQEISDRQMKELVRLAWCISPILAIYLPNRLRNSDVLVSEVTRLVRNNPNHAECFAEGIKFLVSNQSLESDSQELVHALTWAKGRPSTSLSYFSRLFSPHPFTAQYAVKVLRGFPPQAILFYIPQLVQAVRYDTMGYVKEYLVWAAKSSQILAHQIIWNMKTNVFLDEDSKNKDPDIGDTLEGLIVTIIQNLSGPARDFYNHEFTFFKEVTDVSGIIKDFPKGAERKKACLDALSDIKVLSECYLPSNPESIVVDIDRDSGVPLQSAAKAPYLAKFLIKECGIDEIEKTALGQKSKHLPTAESLIWKAAIFKVGDDCRQDMLALQIIQLFKNIFSKVGLDLYLYPYRVVATAPGCGVIECIPNCKSRDQLGRQTAIGMYEYFRNEYGDESSENFQKARRNFIKSVAAYSVVLFLLQIKDRHNGNIMLDKDGHLLHIDFGFMFESSPGGNLGWEPDIKLTEEMVMIMGGKMEAPQFQWFMELCVRGYLAVRPYQEDIVSLVALMLDTSLPCFRGNTIKLLRGRFSPSLSSKDAAQFMVRVIRDSFLSKWSRTYDMIQYYQNQIPYY